MFPANINSTNPSANNSLYNYNTNNNHSNTSNRTSKNFISKTLGAVAVGITLFARSVSAHDATTHNKTSNITTTSATAINIEFYDSLNLLSFTIAGIFVIFICYSICHKKRQRSAIINAENQQIANKTITNFCQQKYKELPIIQLTPQELKDKKCLICTHGINNPQENSNNVTIDISVSNESINTDNEFVLYDKQVYHWQELVKAVQTIGTIPHTREAPEFANVQAIQIVAEKNACVIIAE